MLADVILGLVIAFVLVNVAAIIVSFVSAMRLPGYAWKAAGLSKRRALNRIRLGRWLGYWRTVRPVVRDARRRVPPPPKRDPWSSGDDW